jgi:hypothetical protein
MFALAWIIPWIIAPPVQVPFANPGVWDYGKPDETQIAIAEDINRFAGLEEVCSEAIQTNLRAMGAFRVAVWMNDPGRFKDFEADMAWRLECWEKLCEAFHPEYYSVYLYCEDEGVRERTQAIANNIVQRKKLEELRELLGNDDFFAGRMPMPSAPLKIPYKD